MPDSEQLPFAALEDDPEFRPVGEVARLDQLTPRPCPRCGYDTANDPDRLGT